MIVVSHENEFEDTVWIILAAGMNRFCFIDIASTKEEAYAIIETIKERVTQSGEEQFREHVENVMTGLPKTRLH